MSPPAVPQPGRFPFLASLRPPSLNSLQPLRTVARITTRGKTENREGCSCPPCREPPTRRSRLFYIKQIRALTALLSAASTTPVHRHDVRCKKYMSGRLTWSTSPDGAQLRGHVYRGNFVSDTLFEARHHRLGEEATLRAVDMAIAHARLLRDVVLERRDEVELALRTRQRHVEQALLLLDQRRAAGAELRWKAAIGHVQHVHRVPLLAFRRMHRREDQVVLVEMRIAREVARRCRRIERQLAQECFPASEVSRNAVQLREIRGAHLRLRVAFVIYPLEMRLVPFSDARQLPRPRRFGLCQRHQQLGQGSVQWGERRPAGNLEARERLLRGRRPDAGQELQCSKRGDAVLRVIGPAQHPQ